MTYLQVKPEDVAEIVGRDRSAGRGHRPAALPGRRRRWGSSARTRSRSTSTRAPFVFGLNRFIDPTDIDTYIVHGGYAALAKALDQMSPQEVLDEVKAASLRGRGGGGFPAGVKWETTRDAPGDVKYVIVNADEGDPGAYMDRSLLEGNPHRVLEGLIIGAYAIGARPGLHLRAPGVPHRRREPAGRARAGTRVRPARAEHPGLGHGVRRRASIAAPAPSCAANRAP